MSNGKASQTSSVDDASCSANNVRAKPISVLLICHSYPPVLGGSEIEAQRVCQALLARGHRVRVVCAGGDPMPPVRDWIDPKGVPVRIYAGRWKGAMKDIVFALRVAGMLIRERRNYQVLYFLMQGLHLAVGLPIGRILHKPIVMKMSGSRVIPFMSQFYLGRLEFRWLRRWAQFVMILNEDMRKQALDHGFPPEQLLWMPNPVDTDEFSPASERDRLALRSQFGIPPAAPVAVFCGRLSPEKRLDSLVDAFSLVAQQMPQSRLLLVGDGPARTELEEQARRLNIRTNVQFIGAVNPAQVASWLKIADVFALVSAFEGFSCALAEAMSSGLGCVVSNIPANQQLVQDGEQGLLIPVGDSPAIARAILNLFTETSVCIRMGQTARKCILDNYGTETIAERYEALFAAALYRSGGAGPGSLCEVPLSSHNSPPSGASRP